MTQFGLAKAWDIPGDEQRAVVVGEIGKAAVEACARADAATALADLGDLDAAGREMATARGLWSATRADPFGDLDRPAALLALRRGRLDVAEACTEIELWFRPDELHPHRLAVADFVSLMPIPPPEAPRS